MPLIKFTKSERRRISLFFVCLAFALGAWLFFALSNKYVYEVQTSVRFVDFPENKAFHSLQSDTVRLQVEGTGWQLLFSKLRINPNSVDVKLSALSKQNFITLSEQLRSINQQFASSQKVVSVYPDTLYFDFSSRVIKKIPINLVQDIQFASQYEISDSVRLIPAYVTVTGPKEELLSISSWQTETLKLSKVNQNIYTRIPLKRPVKANINIYPAIADVRIPVDEFTEKSVEVSVSVLNKPSNMSVKLLPDKVKIVFLAALSNYPKIDRNSFKVIVDLENWRLRSYSQLPVKVVRLPPFCHFVRVEPQNLDFIIEK